MEDADYTKSTINTITERLLKGKVVAVLGAGVNLCERPEKAGFEPGRYLPSGPELAGLLTRLQHLNLPSDTDLARVSQYYTAAVGYGPLRDELHEVFDDDYPPNMLHRLLVEFAHRTLHRTRATDNRGMVFLTTNYDDSLERAFGAQEPYDVLTYIAQGSDRGLFRHTSGAESTVIRVPNEYTGLHLTDRALIVKIHGAVSRGGDTREQKRDSYVITEDHYIEYLTHTDVDSLFPKVLTERLVDSHLLFLGYGLRDWNVRAMLYRIWNEQRDVNFKCWAVDAHPDAIDVAAWHERGVDILRVRLEDFVEAVRARLDSESQMV